jgi:hypothetical protein
MEVRRTVCQFFLSRCRVEVHSENGRLIKTEPDKTFPKWDTVYPPIEACIKQRGVKEFMYHPERLNFPLKRVGDKGGGKWPDPVGRGAGRGGCQIDEDRVNTDRGGRGDSRDRKVWYKYLNCFWHLSYPDFGARI